MADLHPTQGNISTLKTSPPQQTTAVYRKQPRYFGQLGRATSYTSNGEVFHITQKPSYYQLAAWDEARRKEPIIKQGLDYIVLAILNKIGPYSHPDPKIDEFVQANLDNKIKRWISEITHTLLWSGFTVDEVKWVQKLGPNGMPQTWLEDLINFHPLQVSLVLNDYGVVSDGEKPAYTTYKSGIYVPAPHHSLLKPKRGVDYMGSLIRLPRSSRFYVKLDSDGNNPYGRSLLQPVLPYHLFKEAYRDMLTTALDRYGTPLVYAIVPPLDTKEMVEEPDGSTRPKTLQEMTVEQMQNLSAESALVFTQISKDQPVQLGALTTGNNFSDAFKEAIELCDLNMLHGMGIPNLLVKDTTSSLGSGGASERQLEMFDAFIGSLFDIIISAFLDQVVLQLIQYNFDARTNPKAYHSGTIQKRPTRYSELKTVIESLDVLTKLGYANPANQMDFRYFRDLVGLPDRDPDPLPESVLPYQRTTRNMDNLDQANGAPSTNQDKIVNPAADHSIEANKLVKKAGEPSKAKSTATKKEPAGSKKKAIQKAA